MAQYRNNFALDFFYWAPRGLCILSILFISLFALDAFSPGVPLLTQISAFLIHLIPSLILTFILALSWKRERAGGIIFILIGIITSPLIYLHNREQNHFTVQQSLNAVLLLTIPFLITGLLFLESYHLRKHPKSP